jgi:hypothetical protein
VIVRTVSGLGSIKRKKRMKEPEVGCMCTHRQQYCLVVPTNCGMIGTTICR